MEISDEVVQGFRVAFFSGRTKSLSPEMEGIRKGLQAAIPLVVEGLVSDMKEWKDLSKSEYESAWRDGYRSGYSDSSNEILAKVKK